MHVFLGRAAAIADAQAQQPLEVSAMFGKPCVSGTRIPVYLTLEKLGAGETSEQILLAELGFGSSRSDCQDCAAS